MPPDEPEIETRKESLISLRLSGPNGRLSQYDQSDEEPASSGDSSALTENGTWDLVDAPKGVKPIGCRWVYKEKYNRYKARLVAMSGTLLRLRRN